MEGAVAAAFAGVGRVARCWSWRPEHTENPRVGGSIPSQATKQKGSALRAALGFLTFCTMGRLDPGSRERPAGRTWLLLLAEHELRVPLQWPDGVDRSSGTRAPLRVVDRPRELRRRRWSPERGNKEESSLASLQRTHAILKRCRGFHVVLHTRERVMNQLHGRPAPLRRSAAEGRDEVATAALFRCQRPPSPSHSPAASAATGFDTP